MKNVRRYSKFTVVSLLLATSVLFSGPLLCLEGCTAFEEEENGDPVPQRESSIDYEQSEEGMTVSALEVENFGPDSESKDGVARAAFRYDRQRAREYIARYARSPNRRYSYCGDWHLVNGRVRKTPGDCTSFASQVLAYAGLPQEKTGRADLGWWYSWGCNDHGSSMSWRSVRYLMEYLISESRAAEFRSSAGELQVGDLIFYRLRREENGYSCDGPLEFNHTTVVSKVSGGMTFVSYHSNDALDVPWNALNGKRGALGEACNVAFVHIKD